jgi:hypothetical protein
MMQSRRLKKILVFVIIGTFLFQVRIGLHGQSEEEIVRQFQKVKSRYLNGQYVNAKTRIERIINLVIEKQIPRNDILGGCYLLLGAIYEKEEKLALAKENYLKAKDIYGIMLVGSVDLTSLSLYRKLVRGEVLLPNGTIEKLGEKKKRKFPWLLVVGSAVVVGAILYFFVLKPKKKYQLTVEPGAGVSGEPGPGTYRYRKGEVINYQFQALEGYSGLQVYLDSQPVGASGQVTMDRNHTLTATAAANVVEFVTDKEFIDIPEGGTATFNVQLSAQPPGEVNVSVNATAGGDEDIVVLVGSLTFTPSNWNTFKEVTLQAREDPDAVNGQAVIRISADNLPPKDIIAREIDRNNLNFLTDTNRVWIEEGKTAGFKVKLSAKPPADVMASIGRAGGDSDISVKSGSNLTFTADDWDRYQSVTLNAFPDDDTENGQATIRISAAGIASKEITATEIDKDSLSFVTNTHQVSIAEGSTASFLVRLSAQPLANIGATVTILSGDSDIGIQSGPTLTFTPVNWSADQVVTLAAAEDPDAVNGEATIRISAPGLAPKDITAFEIDKDSLNFITDTDEVPVPEEGTALLRVRLSAQPTTDISAVVSRVGGDSDIEIQSGSTLIFSASDWEAFREVTLRAAKDEDELDGETLIRIEAPGLTAKNIIAKEEDNGPGTPPEISISEPKNEETVSGDVAIRAVASDDFGIQRVEFYIDNLLVDTGLEPSYKYTWPTRDVIPGPHQIKVIAYDAIDQTGEFEISVTVADAPPTAEIREPSPNDVVNGNIQVKVSAADYKGVKSILLYLQGLSVGSWETGTPQPEVQHTFTINTTAYANGNYTLKAVAVDTADQQSVPAEVSIVIQN